jgi:hypothetical protein
VKLDRRTIDPHGVATLTLVLLGVGIVYKQAFQGTVHSQDYH